MSAFADDLIALCNELTAAMDDDPVVGRMIEGTIAHDHLVAFYQHIWHCAGYTPGAVRRAAESMDLYAGDDPRFQGSSYARFAEPLYRELAAELLHHVDEEKGHDDWMLQDLEALGHPAEETRACRPFPSTAAHKVLLEATVRGPRPVGIFGTATVIEHLAVSRWGRAADNLCRRSTIPNIANAVYCIRQHYILDQDHQGEGPTRLEVLTDPRDRDAILFNARASVRIWSQVGHDILRGERV